MFKRETNFSVFPFSFSPHFGEIVECLQTDEPHTNKARRTEKKEKIEKNNSDSVPHSAFRILSFSLTSPIHLFNFFFFPIYFIFLSLLHAPRLITWQTVTTWQTRFCFFVLFFVSLLWRTRRFIFKLMFTPSPSRVSRRWRVLPLLYPPWWDGDNRGKKQKKNENTVAEGQHCSNDP